MIGEILGLLTSALSTVNAQNASSNYGDYLNQRAKQAHEPTDLAKAKEILREGSNTGLIGYDQEKQDIYANQAASLNALRGTIGRGGGDMIAQLGAVFADSNQKIKALNTANDREVDRRRSEYVNLLSGQASYYDFQNQQIKRDLGISAAEQNLRRTADINKGLNSGANSLGNLFDNNDWSWLSSLFSKSSVGAGQSMFGSGDNYGIPAGSYSYPIGDNGIGQYPLSVNNLDGEPYNQKGWTDETRQSFEQRYPNTFQYQGLSDMYNSNWFK